MALSLWRMILVIAVVVFVALSIICHIIALCTDFWLKSSDGTQNDFLNIGLWRACFDNYRHRHETVPRTYSGCHDLYSDEYQTIQDWLIPCKWRLILNVMTVRQVAQWLGHTCHFSGLSFFRVFSTNLNQNLTLAALYIG
jgi:PMP-22/EMP/MP20/Claudin tight junction